jgi:hypothetical protein
MVSFAGDEAVCGVFVEVKAGEERAAMQGSTRNSR